MKKSKRFEMRKIPFPIPRGATYWFGIRCDLVIPDYNEFSATNGQQDFYYIDLK